MNNICFPAMVCRTAILAKKIKKEDAMKTLTITLLITLLAACNASMSKIPVPASATHQSYAYVYAPAKGVAEKSIAVILLHSKWRSPDDDKMDHHARRLSSLGYKALVPAMPWENYSGSYQDGRDMVLGVAHSDRGSGEPSTFIHFLPQPAPIIPFSRKGCQAKTLNIQ